MLSFQLRMAVVQALALVGGATQSIFPQVEALLCGGGDYVKALEYVAARKKMDRYHSMIDFLFCELHPEWRMSCFCFYAGNGPLLKDLITPAELMEYNRRLLIALEVALKCLQEQQHQSWSRYRVLVEDAMMVA